MTRLPNAATILAAIILLTTAVFSQRTGAIRGQVTDSLGDAVVGVSVTVVDRLGREHTAVTNKSGSFRVNGLVAGRYTVRAAAEGFSLYEATDVDVTAGRESDLPIVLSVEGLKEEVDVSDEGSVSTDANNNASALVLKEEDLESLPDDPDDLEAALQALAGGAAGPSGGQIYIDGFQGGNIPPKESIREIRINRNPFSAEFDRLGFGRIEILTKPGTDKFRGQGFFNFNDDALNSRNPFAENKADSRRLFFGGHISGPVIKKKASFFLSLNNRQTDNGSIVNATVIDPGLNIVPFQQEFTIPSRRFSISPRFDYQLNSNNTLVARYEFQRRTSENQGVAGFSLPTRATSSTNNSHTIRLTESVILNPKTINETRFQYRYRNREQLGDNSVPTINVRDSFVGGGSSIGLNFDRSKNWELQNYTTTSLGGNSQHAIKFGVRVRGVSLSDRTESNYAGTFSFFGFPNAGPANPYDLNADGVISSIEQYRARLLGETDPRYNPNQFTLTAGEPLSGISQYDVGVFLTDDWRVNQGLTLSWGIRYENQTNISDRMNFAPRFSFAYSPGAGGASAPKTVFRGGFGIFYSRFGENLTLQAQRLDGVTQQQYIITGNQAILGQAVFSQNGVTNVPNAAQLASFAPLTSTPRTVASDLQAPYIMQGALSVERQLPGRSTIAVYYVASRNIHLIRSRNINAPVCPQGFSCPIGDPAQLQALRPDPSQGNIFQYESSGVLEQQQLIVSFRTFFSRDLTLFSNYRLGRAKGNSDGGFPVYNYDLSDEYGTSSLDRRHFFFLGGSIGVPFGLRLRPFIIARSGGPFNITTGRDLNGDSNVNERPTFAVLAARCSELGITASWCRFSGSDPNATIPRNFGRGPSFLSINLGFDRTFGFGGSSTPTTDGQRTRRSSSGRIPGTGRRGGRHGGGGRGRGGFFGGGNERKPYNLTVGVRFFNLLNTNNPNTPVGNLISPLFGQSTNTSGGFGRGGGNSGGNRRVEFRTRFRW